MGLFDLFSNDSAEKAAAERNAGLQQGYDALAGQYGKGRDAITAGAGNARALYKPLIESATTGANAYGDASGANGVEGLHRATDTFKNSGQYGVYGFGLDQGLQALQRTHAAAGNLNSGNADADTLKFATGTAGNAYNSYAAGLAPYLGQQTGAVSGAAGVETGEGAALNASYTGQGNAANAMYTGQGASNAAAEMNNYNVGANQFNALMGAANFAAGGIGNQGGAGGLIKNAQSLFSAFK